MRSSIPAETLGVGVLYAGFADMNVEGLPAQVNWLMTRYGSSRSCPPYSYRSCQTHRTDPTGCRDPAGKWISRFRVSPRSLRYKVRQSDSAWQSQEHRSRRKGPFALTSWTVIRSAAACEAAKHLGKNAEVRPPQRLLEASS
jgi:hypothetical protein